MVGFFRRIRQKVQGLWTNRTPGRRGGGSSDAGDWSGDGCDGGGWWGLSAPDGDGGSGGR
jgi:hypothetical protein